MTEKIEIKYQDKTYEIDKDSKEQKVRPKGVIFETGDSESDDNKEVVFKNYQESFWNTSVEANGHKIEVKKGAGSIISSWGIPSTLLLVIGGAGAILYKRFKKPIDDLTEDLQQIDNLKNQLEEKLEEKEIQKIKKE